MPHAWVPMIGHILPLTEYPKLYFTLCGPIAEALGVNLVTDRKKQPELAPWLPRAPLFPAA